MPTSLVPVCGWRWAICSMYCFTVLLVVVSCNAAGSEASLRGGTKKVRFASPVVQGVLEIPSRENTSATEAAAGLQPASKTEVVSYVQTLYPEPTESEHTPTNTTVPEATQNPAYTFVAQSVTPAWRPAVVPGGATFAALPATVAFGTLPVLPDPANPARTGVPTIFSTIPVAQQLTGTGGHPPLQTTLVHSPEVAHSVAATVPVPAGQFMILAQPPAVAGSVRPKTYKDMWATQTRESQLPTVPSFVVPRGKQRQRSHLMEEVRRQEELMGLRHLSPAKSITIPNTVTKGLAIVGAAVAAKKTAQGLASLYKWARGIPSTR